MTDEQKNEPTTNVMHRKAKRKAQSKKITTYTQKSSNHCMKKTFKCWHCTCNDATLTDCSALPPLIQSLTLYGVEFATLFLFLWHTEEIARKKSPMIFWRFLRQTLEKKKTYDLLILLFRICQILPVVCVCYHSFY